jgi:hypothetical protein
MTPQLLDERVRGFAMFLQAAWPIASKISGGAENESLLQDWSQANWEMIVEAALPPGTFLEVYGEGADCNGASSRVYRPDAVATHVVVCRPRPGAVSMPDQLNLRDVPGGDEMLVLEEFVTMAGSWYERRPPFDCVLVEKAGCACVFKLDDVQFALEEVTPPR